jgi:hypothetical protein
MTNNTSHYDPVAFVRSSFVKVCESSGCRAAALNHILYWIGKKAINETRENIQEGKVMYYATSEELTNGISNAWGVCKVRKEVNTLVSTGLLGRGKNPTWGADRTKHFFFGKEQCAKLLEICNKEGICLLHIDLPKEIVHLIKSSNANDKSIKCLCHPPKKEEEQMIDLSNGQSGCEHNSSEQMMKSSDHLIDPSLANDEIIGAITKVSTKVTTKNYNLDSKESSLEKDSANQTLAPDVASLFSFLLAEIKDVRRENAEIKQLLASSKQEPTGDTNAQKHPQVTSSSSDAMLSNSHNAATDTTKCSTSPSGDDTNGTHQHQFPATRHSQQEVTNVPNTPSPTTGTRSSTPASSSVRDNLGASTADTSSSPHGVENKQDVEQKSMQDKQSNLIAKETTKDEGKHVDELAIREVEQVTLFSEVNTIPSSTNKRRTRTNKQKLSEKQTSMKARVKTFCDAFKAIGIEMFDDPDFYVRTPSVKEDLYDVIVDLIESKASQEQMKSVFMEFWNEKGQDGNYWWREPSHLTLNAMCKNFGMRLASAKFKTKQAEKKQAAEQESQPMRIADLGKRSLRDMKIL